MGNDMTVMQAGALAALKGAMPGLHRARQAAPNSASSDYLKNGKDGIWTLGQEEQVVGKDVRVVVNSLSLTNGYVCWTNYEGGRKNEKLGEEMAALNAPPVDASALAQHPFAWKPQQGVRVKFASGPLEGREAIWVTSSVGGLGAMGALIDAIMARVDAGRPDVFPVVSLSSKSYAHRTYGKIYNPVLDIVGWTTMDGPTTEAEAGGEVPVTAARPEPELELEPELALEPATADEPARRRRRSAA